jgi:pyruvate dehydrogenase E2 component (dihydrolipoamide acetyltransferase)
VVRSADSKGLVQISREMRNLTARARARKLTPSEYQGGSATISNLGMYGIESFAAIINPPQACILAVGAGIEQPVGCNGKIELHTRMSCTLSADHRALDGALAARLLSTFKSNIEEPAMMLA